MPLAFHNLRLRGTDHIRHEAKDLVVHHPSNGVRAVKRNAVLGCGNVECCLLPADSSSISTASHGRFNLWSSIRSNGIRFGMSMSRMDNREQRPRWSGAY